MADEVRVTAGLAIRKGSLDYRGFGPTAFTADMDASAPNGPTPGAVNVTTAGVDADLSALTTPGWMEIVNLDGTNYVEWGMRDPDTSTFYPVGELGPGEKAILKLSRNFLEEYVGTGTTGPTNKLHLKADTAACKVYVGVFER